MLNTEYDSKFLASQCVYWNQFESVIIAIYLFILLSPEQALYF